MSTATWTSDVVSYCEALPRQTSTAHEVGPFVLFTKDDPDGWQYSARVRLGCRDVTAPEVRALQDLMGQLDIPFELEWVHEAAPGLQDACRELGLDVSTYPLMVLTDPHGDGHEPDPDVLTAMLTDHSPELEPVMAAVGAAFGGSDEPEPQRPQRVAFVRGTFEHGRRLAGGFLVEGGTRRAIGGGSHWPLNEVTELTGIAVLPGCRGRGAGARLTLHLVADAIAAGCTTIWLSATDEQVARVYERVGFTRVGTMCAAEPASDQG